MIRSQTLKSGILLAHYLFPIALGLSISLVMQRATGEPLSTAGMALFLAGIGAAYSLDRLMDQPADGYPRWLWLALAAAFIISISAGLMAVIHLPIQTIAAVLVFAFASLLYRRLKLYPMAKTILVAVVWTWAGAALPIHSHRWAAWDWWSLSVCWPLVLLMAAGCILCDLKDAEADRQLGVRSLPVVLGAGNAIYIAGTLALLGATLAWTEGRVGLCYSGVLLLAVTQFRPVLSRPAIGPLLVDAILSLPGFLILTHVI